MQRPADDAVVALEKLVREYAGSGTVPLDALNAALPDSASAADMDAAFVWLAERSLQVRDVPATALATEETAGFTPSSLDPFLTSPFALSRLFEAAQPGRASQSGVFPDTLRGGARRTALEHVAEIQSVHAEAQRLRDMLAAKKLSEPKRKELRAAVSKADGRARELLRALPMRDEWLARLVAVFRRAAEEFEQSRTALEELGQRHRKPAKDLRRLMRESRGDDAARHKVARRLSLSADEVERLDQELNTLAGRMLRQESALEMPAARILELLAVTRQWEAGRLQPPEGGVRLSRDRERRRGSLVLDLAALEARVDEIAARACVLTEVPTPKRITGADRPRQRSVALVEKGTAPEVGPGGATYADLGRVGESVVFEIMRGRWEVAARRPSLPT